MNINNINDISDRNIVAKICKNEYDNRDDKYIIKIYFDLPKEIDTYIQIKQDPDMYWLVPLKFAYFYFLLLAEHFIKLPTVDYFKFNQIIQSGVYEVFDGGGYIFSRNCITIQKFS